ncbi:23S rRNA pseudouridine(2604) synthase RluF [Chitinophaga pollutisoli]|uniref:Pseudouridine synthase n=1 Tax=Chitinophaga pollutisoli TaxID=3133966 RepID=A0ABZ2YP31_9BACT
MDESISLNKFISDTGYCSRRAADDLITQGRVLLNDKPATLGNRYKPGDTVEVDGSLITAAKKEKRVYLALNKPVGITTTTELHIKDNIISFVGYPQRIFPIGRLDKDSEGLIFLTNDGDIINKILRAANHHEKEYIVRVNKPINTAFIQQMSQGVPILDTYTLPCKVQMTGRQTFRITLTQGLNRQIRRMCEYLGYAVTGLQRVRIMNVRLDKLPVGKWRHLTETELATLKESISESGQDGSAAPAAKKRTEYIPVRKRPETEAAPEPREEKPRSSRKSTWKEFRAKGGKASARDRSVKPEHKPTSGKPSAKDPTSKPGKPAERARSVKPGKPDHKTKAGKHPAKDVTPKPGKATGKPGKKGSVPQKGAPAGKGKNAGPGKRK